MASNRIVVDIIGNDSSFQAALARSQASASRFGSSVTRSLGSGGGVSVAAQFDPLLARVRETQTRSDELSRKLSTLDDGFQDTAGGARQLSGGLVPMIGRIGLVTFGINAAYQASQHLADALEATGNEAFTSGGKLRNFGAALLKGDLVGGIEALKAAPKTFDELGISITRARNAVEGLSAAQDNLDEFPQAKQLVRNVLDVVAAEDAAQHSADALADSVARLGQVFRDSTGQAVIFKGAVDDLGGPRGPGAVDQINAALELERAGRQGAPPQRPLGPASRNANALIVAQSNQDLDEVLRLQTVQRDKLSKAIENSHGNVKQRQTLARNYAVAVAAVATTQQQIKAQNDAEAKAAADAATQARSDRWAKIIGALDIGVTRAQLTKTVGDDLARLNDLKAGLERQIRAGVDVASAQSRLAQTEISIAGKQEEIRQAAAAAAQARQFRALGLSMTGEEVVPTVDNLRKRIGSALQKFDSGDVSIGAKLVKQLRLARALIVKEGDDLTRVTRAKINEILKAANGDSQGPLTKTTSLNTNKLLQGLGLSGDLERQLRARLSSFNSAGLAFAAPRLTTGGFAGAQQPTVVENHNTIVLDGKVLASSVTRSQEKTARRNPKSKRGTRHGI